MNPNTAIKELYHISAKLNNSKLPNKSLVIDDLNRLIYKLAAPAEVINDQYWNAPELKESDIIEGEPDILHGQQSYPIESDLLGSDAIKDFPTSIDEVTKCAEEIEGLLRVEPGIDPRVIRDWENITGQLITIEDQSKSLIRNEMFGPMANLNRGTGGIS
jgi:hypothetical protein